MKKKEGKHDYSGACAPEPDCQRTWNGTFSVGIFKWLLTKDGKGLKKSPVKFRVKGSIRDSELMYSTAQRICKEMDDGIFPKEKSMTV